MKCPKCGYNSFDHLENCKKCGKDLAEHKSRFNIRSILLSELPAEEMSAVAEEAVAAATATAPDLAIDDFGTAGGEEADDFGFDFMGDSEEEENLGFDELFEEVPAEDEVEETLPAPEEDVATAEPRPLDEELIEEKAEAASPAEFSFDETEPEDFGTEAAEDFGFDDDPDADIFAESEEDFSIGGNDLEDSDKS